ncbi:MAG TPA: type II secretion system F family protein [Clostridiales bacterium]|nr:type II secretion system F family protein [Clostridiales bacterium]
MIREQSLFPVSVKQIEEQNDLRNSRLFSKINLRDLSLFCRQFSTILRAGVPITQCLDILSRQTTSIGLKTLLEKVNKDVHKGKTLYEAMSSHPKQLPGIMIHMIEAGEISGTLDASLDRLAIHFEKEHKLKQRIARTMTYPIVVIIVSIIVVIFLLTNVVPTFTTIFNNNDLILPLPTIILLSLSSFLRENGVLLLVGVMLVVLILRIAVTTNRGRYHWHKFLLNAPVIGKLQRKILSARFTRTLGVLLSTGIPLVQSLQVVSRVANNEVAQRGILEAEEKVRQGMGLTQALEQLNLFPPMVTQMIMIGEDSGTLDAMLEKTADFFEDGIDSEITKLTTLLEPTIIVVLGLIVAFIVLSIALPMFEMMNMVT